MRMFVDINDAPDSVEFQEIVTLLSRVFLGLLFPARGIAHHSKGYAYCRYALDLDSRIAKVTFESVNVVRLGTSSFTDDENPTLGLAVRRAGRR